jgi:cell wall-associated NlpC family hydrolase
MVTRIAAATLAAVVVLLAVCAGAAGGLASSLTGSDSTTSRPSASALSDIPPDYLLLYRAAAPTCPGLDWTVLAAVGSIESDHGRSTLPGVHSGQNYAGAQGPMQFLPATFAAVTARHPPPPGGTHPPSPYDPHDAIHAAAAYLCDSGARDSRDLPGALYAYNHSDAYVDAVLARSGQYRAETATTGPASATAQRVIAFGRAQLGLPYVWGGDGPAEGGFDCSGLTRAAYAAAGIAIPRTAQTQYTAGPPVPAGQPLEPGDLVFYGTTGHTIHHVGLYIGDGKMIHAPQSGDVVRISAYRWTGDDFWGATRPLPST